VSPSILALHDIGDSGGSRDTDVSPALDIIDTDLSVLADCMASLLSFTQVTAQVVAREHGVRVLDSRFDISAALDTVHRGGQSEPSVASLRVRGELTTDASVEQLDRIRAETERRCPMLTLLRRNGVPVTSEWMLRPAA
jgi:hypothetical protein